LNIGSRILINDGIVSMRVEKISGTDIICIVEEGGIPSNKKGINGRSNSFNAYL
jgi:pyruvate kinase